MGMIGALLGGQGVGEAVKDVAEVFTPNATRRMELSAEAQAQALQELSAEYERAAGGWFDQMVNGLNRLPRPLLAFGVVGLFAYAMVDPAGFSLRMAGLGAVPEPLWWLLGAVVSFYFGAREAYYFRNRPAAPVPQPPVTPAAPAREAAREPAPETAAEPPPGQGFPANAALEDWRQSGG